VVAWLKRHGWPAVSVTVAILVAVGAFMLFVAFIHNTIVSLKSSTVIKRIAVDGRESIDSRWPKSAGNAPRDARAVQGRQSQTEFAVEAAAGGFVAAIDGAALVALAERETS
jgi:uncharacterized membrane protein